MSNESKIRWVVLKSKYELGQVSYERFEFQTQEEAEDFKVKIGLPSQIYQQEYIQEERF